MPDFSSYLESVRRHYEQWWSLYTLTDAEGRSQVKARGEVFDFGLMVQTIAPKSERMEGDRLEAKETIERFTVLEGLRKYAGDHVLLVGRPGSGKSTALARLLLEEAALTPSPSPKFGRGEHERIPVLVELRYWNEEGVLGLIRSFLRSLPTQVGLTPVEVDRTTLEELLRSNKFLLLIDGLNELPSEAARQDVLRFRREFPKVAIVFTTRDLSLGGDFGIEKKLEMQPLTETQMKAFVTAYIPEQSEAMLRQLGGRLREFGSTPLLLWMLCGLFRQTGEIPANLGGVFRAFTTGYERSLKADVVLEGDRRWWAGLLQTLAARMIIGDGSVEFRVAIDRAEVEAIFTEFLRDREALAAGAARKALDDLLRHHLIQTNGSQVEFRHQLIQEYYAAEWLLVRVKGLGDATLQQEFLNYLKWTEPVALMLALVEDEGLAVRVVEQALDVDLMLGARLAGEVRSGFQDRTVGLVQASQLPNSINPPEWMKIDLLGLTKSNCAANILNKIIHNSGQSYDLRDRATYELRNIPPQTSISLLVNCFEIENKFIKRKAISSLISLDVKRAVELVLSDENTELRHFTVQMISEIYTKDSAIGIIKLISESKKNIKLLQPKKIKYIEGSGLKDLTVEDTDYEIEQNTISWGSHFIKKMPRDIYISALFLCVNDSDDNVKIVALELFKISGNPNDVWLLDEISKMLLLYNKDVCHAAISALLKIKQEVNANLNSFYPSDIQEEDSQSEILKQWLNFYTNRLTNSDSGVREDAIYRISDMANDLPISLVMNMLDDPNIKVASTTAMEIARLIRSRHVEKESLRVAIPKLINCFQKSDSFNRSFFADALGLLGLENEQSICEVLTSSFKDDHGIACTYEIAALACLQCSEVLPEIVRKFDVSDALIQATIAENLPKFENSAHTILLDLWKFLNGTGGMSLFRSIQAIQSNCKFYNYEIYQQAIELRKADRPSLKGSGGDSSSSSTTIVYGDYIAGDKIGRDKILGNKTEAPNATEVKIFEQVENYYEIPPPTKDPSS